MTEQELLDMFIQERISMLIDAFHRNQPEKSEQEEKRILQAEIFIDNLPKVEKGVVENYIDSLISQFAVEESFLYRHGFLDGIKALKYIGKL
ncbi:hypothetical protein [Anaerocolumna jejuensis]|uniref:hypothetical protein n=1 Tax=Anaerocolumna jejuensis TaxID=259063 RepID=UPI003F7BE350